MFHVVRLSFQCCSFSIKVFNPFMTNAISIKINTVKSELSNVYIGGQRFSFQKYLFFSLKIDFCLANIADHDEMTHYVTFSSGSTMFTKVPVMGIPVHKRLMLLRTLFYPKR